MKRSQAIMSSREATHAGITGPVDVIDRRDEAEIIIALIADGAARNVAGLGIEPRRSPCRPAQDPRREDFSKGRPRWSSIRSDRRRKLPLE